MKIAILTMFNGLTSTYSLVNVVAEHLRMFLNEGLKIKLLVSEDCNLEERYGVFLHENIEWIKITNRLNGEMIHWKDYSTPNGKIHDTFFEETEVIAKDFIQHLEDIDICMMHDIHYQGWHLVHNIAIRKAQEQLPKVRFLAFTHSAPITRPRHTEHPFSARYSPMPNTIYIYPTQSGIPALSKQYNIAEGYCKVINNSLDILECLSDDVSHVASHIDIFSADYLIIYPGRLTTGKKFEKVAAFCGALKTKTEKEVKVIFCDFPCSDINPERYKKMIYNNGIKFGLDREDMLFTSSIGYTQGFPRQGVMDLFTLSNIFVCPSYSESFGLIVLEAASRGNQIVLNECVPALEELGKQLQAYFMRWDARNFGFDTIEKYHPSEVAYLQDHASEIAKLVEGNKVLFSKAAVRRRYSPHWIWKQQLQPLLDILPVK
ncbi:TPA: glycosyltransferase [Bacillus cereus]|uniref:glycosyltransferase n=1 Tax=Bacillus TaxID=1386 RepID=UPI0002F46D22|nr:MULTISPECIES: glycosyltransferase [Bacillus]MED2681656.1 glycosyltransferase [Bacillus thuringiensis]HDR4563398.1 glycosyltransferase [Bacillus luti]AYF06564.1 glycosyltransferase [Bacillus mobilis]MBF8115965.1 glycosyltransferase [Bacillus cereus]MBL3853985.1 glycosyltransferase [Bacillus cereus]